MKKRTLNIFGTAFLASGLLIGCSKEETDQAKKVEETSAVETEEVESKETSEAEAPKEETAEPVEAVEQTEKEVYISNLKGEVENINTEYDRIWNEHWKPAWSEVEANGDVESLKVEMETVVEDYGVLEDNLIALTTDQLSDNKTHMDEYRLNFTKSVSYRKNAARAILQGINGDAEMNDRMEEAKKSIQLADEYLLKAMTNLSTLNTNLGI